MLSNDNSVVRYAIYPEVTMYDIPYPFWDFSEITVTATDTTTGETVTLQKDVDYTLTVSEPITDPVYQDGTLSMISDTYKSYDALVISRVLPLTQDADYKNGEPINADTLEMSLDRATAQIQQVAEEVGHAIKLSNTDEAGDYVLPDSSQRKGAVIGFDADGTGIQMYKNPDEAIEAATNANKQAQALLDTAQEALAKAQESAEEAKAAAEKAENIAEYVDAEKVEEMIDGLDEKLDEEIAAVKESLALPIPLLSASIDDSTGHVIVELMNNYTGFSEPVIRYANGEDPTEESPVAVFPLDVTSMNGTLYFRAFPSAGASNRPSSSALVDIHDYKVKTPTASWNDSTDTLTLSCGTYSATIRYTADGTTPSSTNGNLYTSPLVLMEATDLKAVAIKDGYVSSDILSVSMEKVAAPVFTFDKDAQTVTMSCDTEGASIRYTTDGADPTEESTEYTEAISATTSMSFRIRAFKAGMIDSDIVVGQATYARVFAVQWDYGSPSTALTRLTLETDPLSLVTETISSEPSPATSASDSGSSPFDEYEPWNGMKRRNFDAEGNPSYWDGEEGFSTTSYDTMVWIPEFYIKVVDDSESSKRTYYLADGELDGFTLHPGSGQYVGAYPTSSNNQSRSGKTRTGSQSIVTMRTNAKSKGTGWGLIDIAERMAIQYLYLIEFADWNSQSKIGDGPTSDLSTGQSDTMVYHTGKGTSNVVRYRWIEGLWRSQYEWTDGFNTVSGSHYVSTDRTNYVSDTTTGYTLVGSGSFGGGYMTKLLYKEDMPWLIGMPEPESSTGSDSTYVPDYGYLSGSATYVLYCGGIWYDGTNAGLFYFYAGNSSSYTGSSRGSRLSYKEVA